MSKKLITTISIVSTLGLAAVIVPVAAANGGQSQGGGGCHMVSSPSPTGLTNMMDGSAHGQGAEQMAAMLSHFSSEPFCGA